MKEVIIVKIYNRKYLIKYSVIVLCYFCCLFFVILFFDFEMDSKMVENEMEL